MAGKVSFRRRQAWAVALVLALVAVVALAACSGYQAPRRGTNPYAPSTGTSESSGGQTQGATDMKMGSTAQYPQGKVTLLAAGPGPNDLAGRKTFKLTVRYENTSNDYVPYNPYDWKLENSSGRRTRNIAAMKTQLYAGSLPPGGSRTGDIFYIPPAGDVTKVVFAPMGGYMGGRKQEASWNVK